MRILKRRVILPDNSCCKLDGKPECPFLGNFFLNDAWCKIYDQKLKAEKYPQGWVCLPCRECLEENKEVA